MGGRAISTPMTPPTAACAPSDPALTPYDHEHLIAYLRLLDADADGAGWKEVARVVLDLDPDADPDGAHRSWESHLARARWLSECGYRHLLDTCRQT